MKAVVFHNYGGPEVLRIEDVAEPVVGARDVLVAVHATSVNPVDAKARAGGNRGAMRYKLPWILGLDVSGVVEKIGAEVTAFVVGDAVWSTPSHKRPGCYAERVAIHQDELSLKPTNLSHAEAASLPLVGLTAMQCLLPRLSQRAGQRVFIQAGAGGVGSVAIQIAKAFDAWVATTASPKNQALVTDLGADLVIDYRTAAFEDVLTNIDVALDCLGAVERTKALAIMARGGRLATINADLPAMTKKYGPSLALRAVGLKLMWFKLQTATRGLDGASVIKRTSAAQLAQLAEMVQSGAVRPVIDSIRPMDEIVSAHAHMDTGRARGKIVLTGWC